MKAGPRLLLLACLAQACSERPGPALRLDAPARLRQALSGVSELEAEATLVPQGGARGDPVPLTSSSDHASFTGFLPAQPGDYVLEVSFFGRATAGGVRLFLGRLASDLFSVQQGAVVTPTFSRPLDVLGRPGDAADGDGDGFGNLDEILFGTDLGSADSDGDGLSDGQDCDPRDLAKAFTIAAGGDHEDCDADGFVRTDLPYAREGTDCEDRDATIHPGADDSDCSDGIDRDCNSQTCPSDDRVPPSIIALTPAEGARIGCHAKISAQITDNATVASARIAVDVGGAGRDFAMRGVGGGLYQSPTFSDMSGGTPFSPGNTLIQIVARDPALLEVSLQRSYVLSFEVPSVTRFLPMNIGARSAPFAVQVSGSSPNGVALIRLMAAEKDGNGLFRVDLGHELARATGADLDVTLDPANFTDGEHLIYAVVQDAIGNRAMPTGVPVLLPSAGELQTDLDFLCSGSTTRRMVPVRVLVVGGNAYQPSTMREHLAEARARALALDPGAVMVKAIAFGIGPDGRVGLDDASSFSKRWEYAFYNASSQRWLTVTWLTPAWAGANPVVDTNAGNVSESDPVIDPDAWADTPEVVAAQAGSAGCAAPTGVDGDFVIYHLIDGVDEVSISAGGTFWRGTAASPVSTRFGCQ